MPIYNFISWLEKDIAGNKKNIFTINTLFCKYISAVQHFKTVGYKY